jgi:hypothetical protein
MSQYSAENSPGKGANMNMVPVQRQDVTTVRIRTKNNSFIYGEQSMNDGPEALSLTNLE